MNLKKYCNSCGTPNYYVESAPNFCSGCGNSFNTVIPKPKLKSKAKIKEPEPEEEIEDEELEEIPDIDKLKFKFQKSHEQMGVRFEDLTPPRGVEPRPALKMTAGEILKKGGNTSKGINVGGETAAGEE